MKRIINRSCLKNRSLVLPGAAALLLIACAICLFAYNRTASMLQSQTAAVRWQGENETKFAQVSCFMPSGGSVTGEELYKFRGDMAAKLSEASFEVPADSPLIREAWCGFGSVNVSNGQRRGEVSVTAVGGNFFEFHPITLISGSYIMPGDLMEDRVLLDRETAWLLFGGEELAGMSFEINGVPFIVAGVIEREDDRFSKLAYTEGMGIYMRYDAFEKLSETARISCYELVMAEPVKGFVYSAVSEKFPIGTGEIVDNSYRFDKERLLKMFKDGATRSMHLGQASYPYWENAARAAEDSCLKLLLAALVTALLPLVLAGIALVRLFSRAKRKVDDEYLPGTKEKISEAWRIRARKRWEKKHPNMK